MATYRSINTSFWTDSKIIDDFTPEDKFFYLYLMTNPHTSLCGCYEISTKQIADETGYSKETVEKLIDRMMFTHKVISYSKETKEVLILNWHKYNWTESDNVKRAITTGILYVKNSIFKDYLTAIYKGFNNISIGYTDTMPTSLIGISNTFINNITEINKELSISVSKQNNKGYTRERKAEIEEVVAYLNDKCGTRFKASTDATAKSINARLDDGFTVDDCKYVIDVKFEDWGNDDRMRKYLRPTTLFAPSKFEGYLNQRRNARVNVDEFV